MNTPSCLCLLAVCTLGVTSTVEAQTLAKFQKANLQVSGGEAVLNNNTAAAIYSGRVNIGPTGIISGTVARRNFANGKTNSTVANATIVTSKSKIFGPIVNEGSFTNIYTFGYQRTTNIETLYRADFYIATSISSFFIKGRATQRSTKEIEVYDDGEGTFITTNTSTSISLSGVAFGAGPSKGIFDAY